MLHKRSIFFKTECKGATIESLCNMYTFHPFINPPPPTSSSVNQAVSSWNTHRVWRPAVVALVCIASCATICVALRHHLLTAWCRVLLEKLTGLQLVKKFPAFHGTRRFITALTSVPQPSLSWASPIQSIYPHPTSWRSILIISTHLRLGLPSGLLPYMHLFRPEHTTAHAATVYCPSPCARRQFLQLTNPNNFLRFCPPFCSLLRAVTKMLVLH